MERFLLQYPCFRVTADNYMFNPLLDNAVKWSDTL